MNSAPPNLKASKVLQECKVCGEPAQYVYFGALSCRACKMFFKRNAEQGQVC